MFKATWKNIDTNGEGTSNFETKELAQAWLDQESKNIGHEDAWLTSPTEKTTISEEKDDALLGKVMMYLLPKNYSTEIIDLENDYDYQMQVCYAGRLSEYLKPEELADAMAKMDSSDPVVQEEGRAQKAKFSAHNLAVKAKWKKPKKA